MKREWYLWLNAALVMAYAIVALFIDGNDRLIGLSLGVSRVVIYTLLFLGISAALVSLLNNPRRWLIPVVCIVVYLAFLL